MLGSWAASFQKSVVFFKVSTSWSKAFGFSQAVDLAGASHVLLCSGQTATGDDGSPPTTSDMAR